MGDSSNELAALLRAARAKKGHHETEAAAALGVTVKTLRVWEAGEREPSFGRCIAALTDYLGVTRGLLRELARSAAREAPKPNVPRPVSPIARYRSPNAVVRWLREHPGQLKDVFVRLRHHETIGVAVMYATDEQLRAELARREVDRG